MNSLNSAKLKFVGAMFTFGTIGIVTHFIPLAPYVIVFYRALLAAIFLVSMTIISKRTPDFSKIKKYFFLLILTGILLGINWVFQFMAFAESSVSIGTVCYNTMPIFVMILSVFMFKQKLTLKNMFCIFIAMLGIVFVSNVMFEKIEPKQFMGILYGIIGAVFYALVVLMNKKLNEINSYDKIVFEFIVATIIMVPYIFLMNGSFTFDSALASDKRILGLIMILLLGFFHTGIAYIGYFDSVNVLKPESIAILTYIDPLVALVLSSMILGEKLSTMQSVGTVLILASTIINEFKFKKR